MTDQHTRTPQCQAAVVVAVTVPPGTTIAVADLTAGDQIRLSPSTPAIEVTATSTPPEHPWLREITAPGMPTVTLPADLHVPAICLPRAYQASCVLCATPTWYAIDRATTTRAMSVLCKPCDTRTTGTTRAHAEVRRRPAPRQAIVTVVPHALPADPSREAVSFSAWGTVAEGTVVDGAALGWGLGLWQRQTAEWVPISDRTYQLAVRECANAVQRCGRCRHCVKTRQASR
ncbi:hypothetical protein BC739_006758 [Kutzneria viridogrisea]|uniref:Uncharacterized protein n=1 Tax=Kutzneria viridogrisea TaxID=47990 RepID=A0ABR6BRM6_9PSEU|nr:hypothetical protein [Kutzneria viridogrisea]